MENFEILLKIAINILKEANIPNNRWSIGGGTILSYFYKHRLSKDIDIFLDDFQFLPYISSKVNNISDTALEL